MANDSAGDSPAGAPAKGHLPTLRRRAEAIVTSLAQAGSNELTRDLPDLLHELQIYQVALELQNEELRLSQAALQKSRSHFMELFHRAPVGFFLLDHKGILQEVNRAGADYLGHRPESLCGKPIAPLCAPSSLHLPGDLARLRVSGKGFRGDVQFYGKGQKRIWVHLHGVALTLPEQTDSLVLCAFMDVTAKKEAELELSRHREHLEQLVAERTSLLQAANQELRRDIARRRLAENALKESETRYRSLFDSISEALIIHRLDGRMLEVNRVAHQSLGYTREELLRLDLKEIQAPRYLPQLESKMENLLQGRQLFLETAFRDRNWREIPMEMSCRLIEYRGESVVLSAARNISVRKRAEAEKRSLETQLRRSQKLEAIGTLAGGIAHDFNNILAAIMGYAELASREVGEDHPAWNYLNRLLRAGERARLLIHQIISFSRASEAEQRPVSLNPIIKEGMKLLRASLPSTIELRLDLDEDAGTVRADPVQIHQVLLNLCTNAAHAMEDKGGVLEVSLQSKVLDQTAASLHPDLKPGSYLRLRVRDTGTGIDQRDLGRIFDPFFTTKEVGKGSGMGLAMAHGIIKGHRGMITVESQLGKGADFQVYLPLLRLPEDPGPAVDLAPPPRGREHIMLVDDEADLALIAKNLLSQLGYQVSVFTGSRQALERFKAKPREFDLLVTDYTMPHLTGLDLAQRMLAIRPGLPIILTTGFSQQLSQERALKMGIKRLASKPLLPSQIAKLVREVLDQGRR